MNSWATSGWPGCPAANAGRCDQRLLLALDLVEQQGLADRVTVGQPIDEQQVELGDAGLGQPVEAVLVHGVIGRTTGSPVWGWLMVNAKARL